MLINLWPSTQENEGIVAVSSYYYFHLFHSLGSCRIFFGKELLQKPVAATLQQFFELGRNVILKHKFEPQKSIFQYE